MDTNTLNHQQHISILLNTVHTLALKNQQYITTVLNNKRHSEYNTLCSVACIELLTYPHWIDKIDMEYIMFCDESLLTNKDAIISWIDNDNPNLSYTTWCVLEALGMVTE
jgi:hypothetical protein